MPAGFGVGDHRLFQVDFRASSLLGTNPPKIVRAPSRQLNTKIPRIAEQYNAILEKSIVEHCLNTRLLEAGTESRTVQEVKGRVDKIDEECCQYKRHAEKKCRKIKSGRIPFSPEASVWIRRKQVYESLLRYKMAKIRNRSNLRRTAQRCGIQKPLGLSWSEIKATRSARRNVNTSANTGTRTGESIYKTAYRLPGKRRTRRRSKRSWASLDGRRRELYGGD